MTTDPFTEAARAEAEERFLINPDYPGATTLEWIAIFKEAAEWARAHIVAQEPEVVIRHEEGRPATCEVRRGGVLIFSGRDHSADLRSTAQEPTNAEVEAAARAIFNAQNRNVAEWDTYDGEFWIKRMYREDARAALTAARDRAAPDQPLP